MQLDEAPAVVAAGLGMFADALAAQAVDVTAVLWRRPLPGTDQALAAVTADPRTPEANAEAVRRLTSSRPRLVAIERAGDALELESGEFLHAGPPIAWADASGPMRGALLGALVYEGMADSVEAAMRLAPAVSLAPDHSRHAVGPMAGVISPSMPVFVMHDEEFGTTAYCPLNEGLGKVLRFGAYSDEVIDRLKWMERVLAPVLSATLRRHGPVDLPSILAQAVQMGDEGHNRNRAGTSLLIREIVADLIEVDLPTADLSDTLRFINANDHFMLNLAMGMAKAAADSAREIPGSTMIVAMARNGTEFGLQTAGTGDEWFTGPAEIPEGLYLSGFGAEDANPDLGDSTIMETIGLGASRWPPLPRSCGSWAATWPRRSRTRSGCMRSRWRSTRCTRSRRSAFAARPRASIRCSSCARRCCRWSIPESPVRNRAWARWEPGSWPHHGWPLRAPSRRLRRERNRSSIREEAA